MNSTAEYVGEIVVESLRLRVFQGNSPSEADSTLLAGLIQDTPSPQMYLSLFERLEREDARRRAHARVWEMARQQGVKPISDIEELQGDFWPEEESVDEFLDWVRAARRQTTSGNRSD
jgi:hypothetical protein